MSLKDEQGNEWGEVKSIAYKGTKIHLAGGLETMLVYKLPKNPPAKRVPFEEVDKAASRLCDAIRANIKEPDTAILFPELLGYATYIVKEALAQMKEKAGPTQSTEPSE